MLAIERKNEILNKLRIEQRVLVNELAVHYGVTEETIRRDLDKLEKELSAEFDIEKRAELAVQMQQTVLDDHAFVFCSFLKMSMISKANVTGYESHACDYYQVTADLDIN